MDTQYQYFCSIFANKAFPELLDDPQGQELPNGSTPSAVK